jgi:hypothetical protein
LTCIIDEGKFVSLIPFILVPGSPYPFLVQFSGIK